MLFHSKLKDPSCPFVIGQNKTYKKLPKEKGFSNILYPGERKNKTYKKNLNKDISIPTKILREMEKLNAK